MAAAFTDGGYRRAINWVLHRLVSGARECYDLSMTCSFALAPAM
jgi:hypothetical protein